MQATKQLPLMPHTTTRVPRVIPLTSSKVERYARIILAGIKADSLLVTVDYFTRETLLIHFAHSPAFGRVSTITRYGMIREGVAHLVDSGQLIKPNNSRNYLCLPGQVRRALESINSDVPLHLRYYEHIATMLADFPIGSSVDVMSLVDKWVEEYDVDLTEDNMRVLIRQTLRSMARLDTIVRENTDYTYTVMSRAAP